MADCSEQESSPLSEGHRQREEVLDRFEAAWLAGQRPVIADFLPADGDQRQALLVELVHVDLEFRLKAGEAARVEEYLASFPELEHNRPQLLGLIAREFELRRNREPALSEEEYLRRFPEHLQMLSDALRRQLFLHQALRSNCGLPVNTVQGTEALANGNASRTVGLTEPTTSGGECSLPTVPGYEILRELGRGGMGVVYEACQISLDRVVALKMILSGSHAAAVERKRFRVEAEAIARLQHPNIVQIFEVGQVTGRPFFAMEFVSGGSLAGRLAKQPMAPGPAAELMLTLAQTIQAAHEQGIVHRDLKPGNVMLAADGTPKITDFGLAKRMDSEVRHTHTGEVLGTPSYMAPEQAQGKKSVGPPADIYALGAILYECLTGRPPFRGPSNLETTLHVLHDEPPSVRQLQPRTPRDLETICLKCLRKEPAKRYGTAAELAADLRRFQVGEAVQARPVGRLERLVKWTRRNRLLAALVATVMLGAVLAIFFAVQAERTADREAQARKKAEQLVYFSAIQLAHQDWQNGQPLEAVTRLAACRPDLRGWEHAYLTRLCRGAPRTLTGHKGAIVAVAFSNDGRQMISGGEDGLIQVWDAVTGQPNFCLKGHTATVNGVAFSLDGQRIASSSLDRTVRVWDVRKSQAIHVHEHGPDAVRCVALSPDGSRVYSVGESGHVKAWNVERSEEVLSFRAHTSKIEALALSADGKRLVTGCWDGTVKLWSADTGLAVASQDAADQPVLRVAISPDGRRIAAGSLTSVVVWDPDGGKAINLDIRAGAQSPVVGVALVQDTQQAVAATQNGVVLVWDVPTKRQIMSFKGEKELRWFAAFSPGARRVATGHDDGTLSVWDLDIDAWESRPLSGHNKPVRSVAISRDGRRIVSGGAGINYPRNQPGELLLWDAGTGQVSQRFTGHQYGVRGVDISPDGQRIVSASEDTTVRVWNAESGREILCCQGHGDTVRSVAFSPDGQRIASAAHDNTVKLWDAATGQELLTLQGHSNWVTSVAFSADGSRLASASDDQTAKVWDAATGRQLLTLQGHTDKVLSVAFSRDGNRIVTCSFDNTARVWDARTGREILVIQATWNPIHSAVFSPDGRRIAGGNAEVVRVWDAATGQQALTLRRHNRLVSSVAFSRDGGRLVSGSFDGMVQVWEAATDAAQR
jgi:WD40 repeat protein